MSSPSPPFKLSPPPEAQITSSPASPFKVIEEVKFVSGEVISITSFPLPPLIVSIDIKGNDMYHSFN